MSRHLESPHTHYKRLALIETLAILDLGLDLGDVGGVLPSKVCPATNGCS